jgi:predicted ATPase
LTELVYQKTQGNPFFVTQFLKGLYEDEWIVFNGDLGSWQCDLTKVQELALTDDVVEFMATRLHKLPAETQEILKLAACIGNQFDLETLAIAGDRPSEEVATALWHSLGLGLVLPLGETYKFFPAANPEEKASVERPVEPPKSPLKTGTQKRDRISLSYKFLHDRVQQAAYSLIPEDRKEATHYHIGKLLWQEIPRLEREERIFELVGQLNYGIGLITEQEERDELAQLNLIACRSSESSHCLPSGSILCQHRVIFTGKSWVAASI